MNKVRQFFDLNRVSYLPRVGSDSVQVFREMAYGLYGIPPVQFAQMLNVGAGIEVELENVVDYPRNGLSSHWNMTEDASLRNHGREFLTRLGCRMHHCITAWSELTKAIKDCGWQASDRTSMHVHINAMNMSEEQLKSLILLYILVEKPFFEFAAADRKHNIFCVPFCDSRLNKERVSIHTDLSDLVMHSNKYCAFNLQSVRHHGTVEFRHAQVPETEAHGILWMLFCSALKRAAMHITPGEIIKDIMSLKVQSQYEPFLNKIFFGLETQLPWNAATLDAAVSDAKTFLIKEL